MIAKEVVTGLVLAGGRGSRMGGVDKGLQLHAGRPLAEQALLRLAPQVGVVAMNANRNVGVYEAMGVAVWPDTLPGQPGPLAGLLTGCERCATPYLATVPCDAPNFPTDLVDRLLAALASAGAEIAVASVAEAGALRVQPVFCVMLTELAPALRSFIDGGQRKAAAWARSRRCVDVAFDDAAAFLNVNTPADLQRLQARG